MAEFAHTLVAERLEFGIQCVDLSDIFHDGHDIDDRFCLQSFDGGTADMVHGDAFAAEYFFYFFALFAEFIRPTRVVSDDADLLWHENFPPKLKTGRKFCGGPIFFYSHSMVAVGLGERSKQTRLIPFTSERMRSVILRRIANGISGTSAVIASTVLTARMITGQS